MIDEKKTFELFGYYSYELSPHSGKKVVCVCEDCGRSRILVKCGYKDLCRFCCKKGKRNPMSNRCGESNPNYIDGRSSDGRCDVRGASIIRGLPPPKIYLGDRYCKGMVAHHLTESVIIYIPQYTHWMNFHDLRCDGDGGMMKINILALEFLLNGF